MPADNEALLSLVRSAQREMQPLPTDTPPRPATFVGIRAVVFDIYGTLLISGSGDVGLHEATDSAAVLLNALRATEIEGDLESAAVYGIPLFESTVQAHHDTRRAVGVEYPEVEIRDVWRDVLTALQAEKRLADVDLTDATIERLAIAYECGINPTWPMPNLRTTLGALKAAGIRLGIVSNAQFYTPTLFEAYLGATLTELGFEPDLRVWSYRELTGKPAVSLYAKLVDLLRAHRITPQETLYVGNDMLKDIWAAQQVGVRSVLFAGDRRSLRLREDDERCGKEQPAAVITDLQQIPPMLG